MNIVADIVKDLVAEHYAYLSECERDHTENEKRIAVLKAKSGELQANIQLAEKYFSQQMADRERLFNSASKVLEKAMTTGDSDYAEIAVRIIEVVHNKSPFSF